LDHGEDERRPIGEGGTDTAPPGGSQPPDGSDPPPRDIPQPARISGMIPPVSPELRELLSEAEQRVQAAAVQDGPPRPTPEEEIEAVLPAELLAVLDEPLEEDDDFEELAPRARGPLPAAAREHAAGGTSPGLGGEGTPAPPGTLAESAGAGVSTTGNSESRSDAGRTPIAPEVRQSAGPAEGAFPAVLGPGDALVVVGHAIASRTTGSLCIVCPDLERRVLLREGDLFTCASTGPDETLLGFLGVRGDLPRETVRRLASKFAPFGRHAGAALVARGYLSQDQMWPTLRAHAEWLLGRVFQTPNARLAFERQPPGRLAGEPSVFGGSTGAAVFVDVVRRVVPPGDAVERLGGLGVRIASGPSAALLPECSLAESDAQHVRAAAGRALRVVLDDAKDSDLATILLALAHLGVIEVVRSVGDVPGEEDSRAEGPGIDGDAIRERVRARMQIVEDGDYFAVLGVPRDATGYEIRRAFLDLRRAFDPSRLLTHEAFDLADDVRKIGLVLEEAYEILKDEARRERYRNAIEAQP
jgi:hypothetical protein